MIDDIPWTATGTLDPDVEPFSGSNVTLTYPDITELSSTLPFNGTIGTKAETLAIANKDGSHTTICVYFISTAVCHVPVSTSLFTSTSLSHVCTTTPEWQTRKIWL
jgi:hypothetical protein